MSTKNCEVCNEEFIPKPSTTGRFCSYKCSSVINKIEKQKIGTIEFNKNNNEYLKNPNKCKECNTIISYNVRRNIFCSHSCSARNSNKTRIRIRKIKAKTKTTKIKKLHNLICQICNKSFVSKYKSTKTCSIECATKIRSLNISKAKKGMTGILRNRAGRGKSGRYNGFWLSSTWELAYYIWCQDKGIDVIRNSIGYSYHNPDTNTYHKFYPDFIINGRLTEIKGYKSKLVEYKLSGVTEPIDVLYKEELKEMFQYVENKTNIKIKDIHQLYDER